MLCAWPAMKSRVTDAAIGRLSLSGPLPSITLQSGTPPVAVAVPCPQSQIVRSQWPQFL